MKEASVPDIRCPGCDSLSFTAGPNGVPICKYCHTIYAPPERMCLVCGATYEPDASNCLSCDADLTRECSACGTMNPLLASKCMVCGQGLDVVDAMLARVTRRPADQQRRVREEAARVKAQEEAASQDRLAEMWTAEKRRREALAQAQAERNRQQRTIVTVTVAIVVIVVVVIIAVVIVTSSAPGL